MLRIKNARRQEPHAHEREGQDCKVFRLVYLLRPTIRSSKLERTCGSAILPKAIGESPLKALSLPDLSDIRIRQLNELDEQIRLYDR